VLHDPVHGEPSYTCVTLYSLLIITLTQSSMLQDASLFPLPVVALSVSTLLAAWARTSTEAQKRNHLVHIVAWKVSKALTTILLLGLAVFSAVTYESDTIFAVSSALPTVRSP
jgi:cobalamin synthase